MSAKDFKTYGGLLQRLVGRALALALPTNTIKLMANRDGHSKEFVWIDPPWQLLSGGSVIATAADYPDPDSPDYVDRHEEWCAIVRPVLDGAVLEGAESHADGTTVLSFRGGVCLRLQNGEPDAEPLWYDDWYVSDAEPPNNELQQTRPAQAKAPRP